MIFVFVYGTLLSGESNHHIVSPYLLSAKPGSVYGRLYNVGSYPALVIANENNKLIAGEWLEVNEEGLLAMDKLEAYKGPGEDNEYERVWIGDSVMEQEGWVYVWLDAGGLSEIDNGSWKLHRESLQQQEGLSE
jgi:gamma-glutamylcyclotransferase (GGCT)/AIG2-like uncharacterized protein YtfP